MSRTYVPEEESRATDLSSLANDIRPTSNRVVHVDSDDDGAGNFFYWDPSGEASNADGTTKVASNISEFSDGGSSEGLWRRMQLPVSGATTDDLSEGGSNKYYTESRFNSSFSGKSTDDLSEGSTNEYFTNTRARNALSASGDLNYDSSAGDFSVTTYKSSDFDSDFSSKSTDDLSEGSTNQYFSDSRAISAIEDNTSDLVMSGDIDLGSTHKIKNIPTPTADGEVAPKKYVDAIEQGLDIKDSVRAGTDGKNVDLSSSADPGDIDGVSLSNGDRVLLKDQNTGSENGIYNATNATDPTTWVRSEDANDNDEVTGGAFTFVEEGSVNSNRGFVITTNDPTLGTDGITFTQFSGAGQITAGRGLTKDGDVLKARTEETIQDIIYTNVLSGTQTLINVTYDDASGEVTYVVNDDLSQYDNSTSGFISDLSSFSTDDLSEGSNLYFTDERAQDATNSLLSGGSNISLNYDDAGNTLTISSADSQLSDEEVQDAVYNNVLTGSQSLINVTYDDASNEVTYTVESNLSQYNNDPGFITGLGSFSTDDLSEGGSNLYFTNERAQDAVGNNVGGNLTYTDSSGTVEIDESSLAGNGLVDDGSGSVELDVSVVDSGSGVTGSTSLYEINFASGLNVIDDTSNNAGRVDINVDTSTATNIDVDDSGTDVATGIQNLDFTTGLSATDQGGGTAAITNDVRAGSQTYSGDGSSTTFTFAHGLSAAPSSWSVEPATDDASGVSHSTADGTNITVEYDTAPPNGTDNLELNFIYSV